MVESIKKKGSMAMLDRYRLEGDFHGFNAGPTVLFPSYQRLVLDPMLSSTYIPPGERGTILDIASGIGNEATYMESKGYNVIKLDLSREALSVLHGQRIIASFMDIPFRDNSLDCIHMKDALIHVPDLSTFFTQIQRVLKPTGIAVLTGADNKSPYFGYLRQNTNIFSNDESELVCKSFTTPEEYYDLATQLQLLPSTIDVGPPYFSVTQSSVLKTAKKVGLFAKVSKWNPTERHPDWYIRDKRRVVYYLRKYQV